MKNLILFLILILIIAPSYGYLDVKKANVTEYDYDVKDTGYYNSRYEPEVFMLNRGSWQATVTKFDLKEFRIPFVCAPKPIPKIEPAYILEYSCSSDVVACGDPDFSYTPSIEYIHYETPSEEVYAAYDFPERRVHFVSPLDIAIANNSLNQTLLVGLERAMRYDIFAYNNGTETLNVSFTLRVPSYILLSIHTDRGTMDEDQFEAQHFVIKGGDKERFVFDVTSKLAGGGEALRIEGRDAAEPCIYDMEEWGTFVFSIYGRFVRVLTDLDFLAVFIILVIAMFIIVLKDKLFK
jgi:hypothetical protein